MQRIVKKRTFRRVLNTLFRIPKQTRVTRLNNNVVCHSEVYKNKEIIRVFSEVRERFKKPI